MEQKYSPEIIRATSSKIGSVDFDHLKFGNLFTDHMLVCDYKNGAWQKPVIKPYEPFLIDPSSKVFHYGQAIFEGMKAYRADDDSIWLFRPEENHDRFNKSATRLAMPEIPADIFLGGLHELVKLEADWVKPGIGNSLYIRPFMIATGTGVVAAPSSEYRFMIILSPAKAYYSGEVKVIVAEHFSRAANGGIGAAKAAGNYSAQFYPQKLANDAGYQQVIWTDDSTHTKLEEAGTMNVFFRIGDQLLTAPTSERILDGVTRKSLIELGRTIGLDVVERPVLVDELVSAARDGSLKEIFGAGTAAVVSPISGFCYREEYFAVEPVEDSYAATLKKKLTAIQHKTEQDPFGWTVRVV